jgi:uncharacterized protein
MTPRDRDDSGTLTGADPGGDLRFSPRPNRAHEIAWRPWSAETFDDARRQKKPVLLAISAVWCHWCHVMDETTYSDPRVLAAIADGFVAVRIDTDRRPDLNRRYNMGGWPTTAFLTPAAAALTGATYLPPERMLSVLEQVRRFVRAHPGTLIEAASPGEAATAGEAASPGEAASDAVEAAPGAHSPPPAAPAAEPPNVEPTQAAAVCRAIAALFDQRYGGLGDEPKFPQADAIGLLLVTAVRGRDEGLLTKTLHSLDAIAAGELHDHVEHGFFRYATRRDWTVPHFEKLLDDNARLALLYLDGFAWSARPAYATVAAVTIEYLTTVLRAPGTPVFRASQDADERYYNLDSGGRAAVESPAIDPTILVDANALAARVLLRAWPLLDRGELLDAGLAALDHLWERGHGRHAMAHYLGGPVDGLLGDQAQMTAALLDAYEASGDRAYLARARLLADWVLEHLRARDGRFLDRFEAVPEAPAVAGDAPLPVLDGGAEMSDALIRLAAFGGVPAYRHEAARALSAYASSAAAAGPGAAPWALAVTRYAEHPTHVVVVGRRGDPQAGALLRVGLRVAEPLRSVQLLDRDADAEAIAREGYAVDSDQAAAFVCLAGVCLAPTSDPAALTALIARSTRE